MNQFQRVFSTRAAIAFRVWVCNDPKHLTAIDPKTSVRRISVRTTCEIILMTLTIIAGVQTTRAQETSNEAKQAQNPIARLISVPFENDFNPHTGISQNDEYILQVKPVVPIKLSNDWNLITRTVIPVIQTPDLTPSISGTSGVGDVSLSLFLSPSRAFHQIIWGAGPIVSFPTASENILGTKKVSVGPHCCCSQDPRALVIWDADKQRILCGGAIGAKGCQSDVHAAIRKLQLSSRVVSRILTGDHRGLGETTIPTMGSSCGRRSWEDRPF